MIARFILREVDWYRIGTIYLYENRMKVVSYSPKVAARFYVPLLLQAFSQSLTYPLVGAIISHGPDGVNALTAFSLGQIIQFMIGALAILVRVFNTGYPEGMMLAIILMNALAPVVDHYVVQANINRRNRRAKKSINA